MGTQLRNPAVSKRATKDSNRAATASAPKPIKKATTRAVLPLASAIAADAAIPRMPDKAPRPHNVATRGNESVLMKLHQMGVIKKTPPKPPGLGHRTKDRVPVQVTLPISLYQQLRMVSATQGVTITGQVMAALRNIGYEISESDFKSVTSRRTSDALFEGPSQSDAKTMAKSKRKQGRQ